MNVFVTGATGTLGKPTLKHLLEQGHTVKALARSESQAETLRKQGVETAIGSLFDAAFLKQATKGVEAVLHLATKIPPSSKMLSPKAWLENDRIRSEGTRLLVATALENNVNTFIYPSITMMYPDRGEAWIDETVTPVMPPSLHSALEAETAMSRFAKQGRSIILRMGRFYGTTTPSTFETIATARRGLAFIFGEASNYQTAIWVEDAATAVVAALEEAPAGLYNVTDDEPVTKQELIELIAKAVNRKRLFALPTFVLNLLSSDAASYVARSQRVSNKKFKEATTWQPKVKSARDGWKIITEHEEEQHGAFSSALSHHQ